MNDSNEQFFSYKGKPLVRSGNTIYYGNMMDDYVVLMQILSVKKDSDIKIADNVMVQLVRTDKNIKPQDMIVKKSEKGSLYQALDIADIWLRRALSE